MLRKYMLKNINVYNVNIFFPKCIVYFFTILIKLLFSLTHNVNSYRVTTGNL